MINWEIQIKVALEQLEIFVHDYVFIYQRICASHIEGRLVFHRGKYYAGAIDKLEGWYKYK
jgi:hypothetical protein